MRCLLLSFFVLYGICWSKAQTGPVWYEFKRSHKGGHLIVSLKAPNDSLIIHPEEEIRKKEYEQPMLLNGERYKWHHPGRDASLLFKDSLLVATLTDNIMVRDTLYEVHRGSSRKEWNYVKNGKIVLTCAYEKKHGKKYIVLQHKIHSVDEDVLKILALYYGQSFITNRSNTPFFIVTAIGLVAARSLMGG